jgi:hypothetical protein
MIESNRPDPRGFEKLPLRVRIPAHQPAADLGAPIDLVQFPSEVGSRQPAGLTGDAAVQPHYRDNGVPHKAPTDLVHPLRGLVTRDPAGIEKTKHAQKTLREWVGKEGVTIECTHDLPARVTGPGKRRKWEWKHHTQGAWAKTYAHNCRSAELGVE